MRITWMAVLLLMAMATTSFAGAPITVGVAGNGDELGGFVGVGIGEHTILGMDARWLDGTENATEGFSVCAALWWTAVPEIAIPVAGLLPQWEIPGLPESVNVALDIGGRVGATRRDETLPEAVVMAQIRLSPDSPTNLCVRWEHKFDDGLWSELGDPINQQALLLCIQHTFK